MNLQNKIESDYILNTIRKNFRNEIYLVGGTVRDYFLDKQSFDRDLIICDKDAKEFSKELAHIFDATFIPLDEINKIYRLVLKDKINYIDITNPVENSLEKDLKRRDFTMNAIAVNLKDGNIIDLSNGINDIKNKKINIISEDNLLDDPLRMFRAYRFQATTGFEISNEIINFTNNNAELINKCAKERINYELMKLFSGKCTDTALLNIGNLLDVIIPAISDMKKVPPNSHHHLDLFHHSIETVKQVSKLYKSSAQEIKKHLDNIDFGGFTRFAYLKLAAFLHDIGKFSTWTIIDGRHRFIKHDDVGSKIVVPILKKLCFSNKQIEYISLMIKNHIYPSSLVSSPELNEKNMMRFVRKMDTNSIDVIMLAMADRLSTNGPEITEDIINSNIKGLSHLLDFYLSKSKTLEPLPKLLDGNDIMQILNLKPSPRLGEIIEKLYEAQISGDILTKEDAISFIKNL